MYSESGGAVRMCRCGVGRVVVMITFGSLYRWNPKVGPLQSPLNKPYWFH